MLSKKVYNHFIVSKYGLMLWSIKYGILQRFSVHFWKKETWLYSIYTKLVQNSQVKYL